MTAALALGVTAAVTVAIGAGAWLFLSHHNERLLEAARNTARLNGDLIRAALEHQMIENDRDLIREMVDTFGRDPGIAQVLIVDREGRPQFASNPLPAGTRFALDSATCRPCHRDAGTPRSDRVLIEGEGGRVLRSVLPIENRKECHGCHDPETRINGVLIVDVATGERAADVATDVRWFVLGSGGLALGLLAAIALVVRLVVLRRLRRFEAAAREVTRGDLSRRVPVSGNDTLSRMSREFNAVAETAGRLLADLQQQQERLETVINSVDDGIVVLDRERAVVAANEAFLQRAGRTREQLVGRPCREIALGLCGAAECPGEVCLAKGERTASIVARSGPDGRSRHEEVRASPIRDGDGAVSYVVEVWRDITERRAAEARLAESHRLASLGLLASGFSHELNTPLGTVLMCVESILRSAGDAPRGGGDDPPVLESARIAREQLLRCRGITQHFLRMSRGQGSATTIVQPAPIVAGVVRLVQPTAKEHGVTVTADAGDGSPLSVRADDAQLEQVLLNILLNAVQACDHGGQVRTAVVVDDRVRIRIRDDGRGIPPEDLERIFEPFFSRRPGGTGLGLFLSLGLVRGWGGDITVSSEPGKGSSFEIVFPATESGGSTDG